MTSIPDTTDIDALSRSFEVEARFHRNLVVFESIAGEAFPYRRHAPRSFAVAWGPEDYLTLVDRSRGDAPVYPGDPRAWARDQVAAFRRAPEVIAVDCRPIAILDEEGSAHIRNSNRAMRVLQSVPREAHTELDGEVTLMLMLGCGLGYQIEGLLEETDIRHLCIIEPDEDVFHASLHAIDWLPILQHFSEDGRSLELIVGEGPEGCHDRLELWLSEIGGFNLARPYVFQHLVSEETAAAFDVFPSRVLPRQTSLLGYFDDERVGLAHTLRNVEEGVPVLKRRTGAGAPDVPAFVVANGPSLDDTLDTLRTLRDRMVLISCGTALGSLMKAGLRPDIHVEMERDSEMREWIEAATTRDDRDAMVVLGLNTVHPDVFRLFPRRGMALKANDVGAAYVADQCAGRTSIQELTYCNPTVANCATALALEIGFRSLYLVGTDFGFPAGDKHHSSLSLHYDVTAEHQEALGITHADDARNISMEGNFGGKVTTNALYQRAGRTVARALARHPEVTCYNLSAGLRIDGAHPLRPPDLKLDHPSFDTRAAAVRVVQEAFGEIPRSTVDRRTAASTFVQTSDALRALEGLAAQDVVSQLEALRTLSSLHRFVAGLLADDDTRHIGGMLSGSVALFSLLMALALHRTADPDRNLPLYRTCRDHFLEFCRAARLQCTRDVLAPDERRRELEAKLA